MQLPVDTFPKVERRLADLAAELLLARPESDQSVVPVYSLVSELQAEVTASPPLLSAVRNAKSVVETLLDRGRPFDRTTLLELDRFVAWLRKALAAQRRNEPHPAFAPFRVALPSKEVVIPPSPLPPDSVLEVDLGNLRSLLVDFHAEALEHLDAIERACLGLETSRDNREAVDEIFRSFHSIKGNAGFLKLQPMQLLAHEVESLLDLVRRRQLAITPLLIDQVLRGRDAMASLVDQLGITLQTGRPPEAIVPIRALLQLIRELPQTEAKRSARPSGGSSFVVEGPQSPLSGSQTTVRLPIERVNQLLGRVEELVVLRDQLDGTVLGPDMAPLLLQMSRAVSEIEQVTRDFKRVPILPAFQKMQRLVRVLAPSFGKQVSLVLKGGSMELDRSIVEGLMDPLMHMVRNALDHGIETPAERRAAGKKEEGMVALRAFEREDKVLVEMEDDGRGIDPEGVLRVAIERGIVKPGARLERAEVLALIFAPGFSMAKEVTAVSGRGVGMDVLKRNIERLGGKIEIESELGVGTRFRIILPMEGPTVLAHVFRSGTEQYVVGSGAVLGLAEIPRVAAPGSEAELAVDFQGDRLALRRLGLDGSLKPCLVEDQGASVLVLGAHGRRLALLVDQFNGREKVIISRQRSRPRDKRLEAGVATLADGSEAGILNVSALILEAPLGAN